MKEIKGKLEIEVRYLTLKLISNRISRKLIALEDIMMHQTKQDLHVTLRINLTRDLWMPVDRSLRRTKIHDLNLL